MEVLEVQSKVYGKSTVARSKVYEWYRWFTEGRESIKDNKRVGRLSTSRKVENVLLVFECVRKDRCQTLKQIAESTHFLKTSFEGIHSSSSASVLAQLRLASFA
ncbi:hypothetical protein TNCV_5072441 [Trichonephila clavipes]|nr:hypothetical protein TNCV_5072441 [Trichonephila clavipes]